MVLPNTLPPERAREESRATDEPIELGRFVTNDSSWGEARPSTDPEAIDSIIALQEVNNLRKQISRLSNPPATRKRSNAASEKHPAAEDEATARPFDFASFLQASNVDDTKKPSGLGVVWKEMTVEGQIMGSTYVRTLVDAVIGTFGVDWYKALVSKYMQRRKGNTRELIKSFTGINKPGEIMLVLGPPGSGCTTFLRAVTNKRGSYTGVYGDVHYGGIEAREICKKYRGEIIYNGEQDDHIPLLTVDQTISFALYNKTKKRFHKAIPDIRDVLLRMFGISHTKYTKVGNSMVRGVSGGERKRVSIAETLAMKYIIAAWDNSTRGLDSSTAVDYVRSLRVLTDVTNRTTFLTLYQAGESIFELADRVMVIENGECIYNGPRHKARQYFVDLGFLALDRQTTADFLTSLCNVEERRFRDGMELQTPKTAKELADVYRKSSQYQEVCREIEEYEASLQNSHSAPAIEFRKNVKGSKSKTVPKSSQYTVSFFRQVVACTYRQAWRTNADRTSLATKTFINISNAFLVGGFFFQLPPTSAGAFGRGGALFFSVLFNGWLQMSEIGVAFEGRPIVERHKDFALYRPSAVVLARIMLDIPMIFFHVTIFSLIMYFMVGFQRDAGKFFIYYLFVYLATFMLTQFYRMFVAFSPHFDEAIRLSGTGLNVLILFAGYLIPKQSMIADIPWFGTWLYYLDSVGFIFEAVVANEFTGLELTCTPEQTVPNGPSYTDNALKACTLMGGSAGQLTIPGSQYVEVNFAYSSSHIWRNFGIALAYTIAYILVAIIGSEINTFARSEGSSVAFTKGISKSRKDENKPLDEESGPEKRNGGTPSSSSSMELGEMVKSEALFTWKDLNFSVPYLGEQKQLLTSVTGYTKPGSLTALMGASGAGKTTLLNTLAQRNDFGTTTGEILVDGKPLGISFQRGTGFCEQQDIHDDTATVREALEFSGLLRQEWVTPREEKLSYIDFVIRVLELEELQNAVIGSLGVEQRKRVTIGVELAARPSLLLFLDEPTSGLDSQGAFNIIRFLRKLADAGQAILCTIHQPSTQLIEQFDRVLALNPGGKTFYYGPVGDNGKAVIDYFDQYGEHCEPDRNVAEFLLEVGRSSSFNDVWAKSNEAKQLAAEVDAIHAERANANSRDERSQSAFATPVWYQCLLLSKRVARNYWRDASYGYGKLFAAVIGGILAGFTFYQLGNNTLDLQNRLFSAFFIFFLPPTVVNAVIPKIFEQRNLWERRELPSRIYGWQSFCFAQIVNEIPYAVAFSIIFFLLWYPASGISSDVFIGGYTFLMVLLFTLFMHSLGQWISAFAPTYTVISNFLPFMFVVTSLFNGIILPYAEMNHFFQGLYYANPNTVGHTLFVLTFSITLLESWVPRCTVCQSCAHLRKQVNLMRLLARPAGSIFLST